MSPPEITGSPHADRGRRAGLGLLVVAWGAQAIVTQSLLLREALVLMFGSELAWGVVLFAWLLGVALGGALGGWIAERLRRPEVGLVVVLIVLSVAACVELWIFRGARAWLGVEPGELLPLPKIVLAALLFITPASALIGVAFPLACCVLRTGETQPGRSAGRSADSSAGPPSPAPERDEQDVGLGGPTLQNTDAGHNVGWAPLTADNETGRPEAPYLSFGSIYALESAGSLVGGAAFSFWAVEHLSPIQTALLCGAITAAASAGLLLFGGQHTGKLHGLPMPPAVGLAVVAVGAALLAVLVGEELNRWLVERRWRNVAPGYKLIAETESKYQNLAVGERGEQYSLYCDGQLSADFPDPYTFAPLAHFWLCQHPSPQNVLVLGGGAEGLLTEILRHPVEHVDYVEVDPRQIELVKPFLTEEDRQALADPRVSVHYVDARYYVKKQRDWFDLVIARVPEPTSALRARFYTDEFFGELRRAMTPRAVLCMTVAAAPGELSAASREYLASVRATLQRHFPDLTIGWGHPAQVLAATQTGLTTADPEELTRRYQRRGVESPLFHPLWFDGATDWLNEDKLARRWTDLDEATAVQISTDLRPSVYLQRLVLWEAVTSGGVGPGRSVSGVIRRLGSVQVWQLVAALAGMGVITLVACRVRRRTRAGWAGGAVVLSVGTTGFATMALSIVWLFAFQNLYGYVYQRIGWIIALFMAGLVIGSLLGERISTRWVPRGFSRGGPESVPNSRPPPLKRWATLPALPDLWRYLILVDVLLVLLALAVPFLLPALGALQSGPGTFALVEWCVSVMVVITGILGGAAFPLAGRLELIATGRVGRAAGSVVGADHAGACLGALLCGILLVPIFGTAVAALLLAGMKACSALTLIVGLRFARSG